MGLDASKISYEKRALCAQVEESKDSKMHVLPCFSAFGILLLSRANEKDF
jgi:hypothetical protein